MCITYCVKVVGAGQEERRTSTPRCIRCLHAWRLGVSITDDVDKYIWYVI